MTWLSSYIFSNCPIFSQVGSTSKATPIKISFALVIVVTLLPKSPRTLLGDKLKIAPVKGSTITPINPPNTIFPKYHALNFLVSLFHKF